MSFASTISTVALAALALAGAEHSSSGTVRPSRISPRDSLPSLARFFEGEWRCRGGTPAGKVLEADVTFARVLDARWIKSEHIDISPGRYRSTALWPADSTAGSIATTIYDNFGGARRFAGTWGVDSIVWQRDTAEAGSRLERFTYRRISADAYWYAWHIRPASGLPLVLGDSATCRRIR